MRQPFRNASIYIILLLVIEAVIGVLLITVTAYYHLALTGYLSEIECRMVHGYLLNIYIFGAQLILTFLCSLSMWRRLWKRRSTPNIQLLLSIWLFYSCIIVGSGLATVWNVYRSAEVFENGAETSLIRGIDMYYSCPEWKLLWDGLQLRKECCGVHSYKDWMNADWMPQLEGNDSCSTAGGTTAILAPYTCCKRGSQSITSQDTLVGEQQGNSRQPFPSFTLNSIHTNGCLPVFTKALWRFLYIMLGLGLLSLKFLVMLCFLTKFILQRQNESDGCDNVALTDDDGYPLVVVKYPSNVRCLVIGEDDLASDVAPDVHFCHCDDLTEDDCEH
ncbi:tetraspanin-15 [Drosophila miranda]|uniref:tetraspanin-15 n=1 Tax=Drosophila miranda TaxID=7229 RepID=UPI0007E65A88|nr:tetraspanin-15 [Drosophila miranda]